MKWNAIEWNAKSNSEYPVTHMQAVGWIRSGGTLTIVLPSSSGKTTTILMKHERESKKIIVQVAYGWIINLNWKQALGLLRRNYVRSYMETV